MQWKVLICFHNIINILLHNGICFYFVQSVNVGVEFQALVTDGLSTYDDVLPYENNDELLWDPNVLGEDLIEDYLKTIQQITKASKPKTKIVGIRDNEKVRIQSLNIINIT